MENISKHITFAEATQSPTAAKLGINNNPDKAQLEAMKLVAEKCFEPLRTWYNKPIKVNSFFRSDLLNRAVKGSLTSQHKKGEAIDIDAGSKEENKKIFEYIKNHLDFDQVINEYNYSWVHVSYSKTKNRKQILIIK
jgi:zinc D-Ala-D-Ala carboxypeptidase